MFQQETIWRGKDALEIYAYRKESEPGFLVIIQSLVYHGSFVLPLGAHEICELVLLHKTAGSLFLLPKSHP